MICSRKRVSTRNWKRARGPDSESEVEPLEEVFDDPDLELVSEPHGAETMAYDLADALTNSVPPAKPSTADLVFVDSTGRPLFDPDDIHHALRRAVSLCRSVFETLGLPTLV